MSMILGPCYMDFAVGTWEDNYGFENTIAEPLNDLDEFASETVLSLFDSQNINIIKAYGVRTFLGWKVFSNENDADDYIKECMKEYDYGRC